MKSQFYITLTSQQNSNFIKLFLDELIRTLKAFEISVLFVKKYDLGDSVTYFLESTNLTTEIALQIIDKVISLYDEKPQDLSIEIRQIKESPFPKHSPTSNHL